MTYYKPTQAERVFLFFVYFFLLLLVFVTLYPLLHVLFASISDSLQLTLHRGVMWRPLGFSLRGYEMVLSNPNIFIGYRNTIINMTIGTTLNLLFTAIGAYVLSRKRFMPRNAIMLFILVTMYFSGGMIPLYLTVLNLGLLNSRFSLILPQ